MIHDPFLDPPRRRSGCLADLAVAAGIATGVVLVDVAANAGAWWRLLLGAVFGAGGLAVVVADQRQERRQETEGFRRHEAFRAAMADHPSGRPRDFEDFTMLRVESPTEADELFNLADPGCGACRGLGQIAYHGNPLGLPCSCTGLSFSDFTRLRRR